MNLRLTPNPYYYRKIPSPQLTTGGRQSSDKKYITSQISDNNYISQISDKKKGIFQFSDNIEMETSNTVHTVFQTQLNLP